MKYLENSWKIISAQPDNASLLEKELNISPLLSKLLVNRNIKEPESAKRFLSSKLQDLRPPFLMKDIKRASRRIIEALYQKEQICIFGDYDVDGITGTALLKLFLDSLGADVSFYIPNRLEEGYGLHIPALEKIHAQGTSLTITVDCGISDYEEVAFARDQGMDVIVTDHHEVPEKIPNAYAVINPKQKQCEFPFKHLAGVGVVFYLIIALRKILREEGFWAKGGYPNLREYLDLVALGTVADIVPLVEENRIFVKYGLETLNFSTRLGIASLKRVSRLEEIPLTPNLISYRLAPRINAAGRMGKADKGVILLTTSDSAEAEDIARELDEDNVQRQQIEKKTFNEACLMIEESEGWVNRKAFVLESPNWHPGVIGIVASRIVEKYYRPTILISVDGSIGRGSARSIEAFHMYDVLKQCEDLLDRFGGHEAAAGLTICRDNISELRERMNNFAGKTLRPDDIIPKLYIDNQIALEHINESFIEEIQSLTPFGTDNPEPLFVSEIISVKNCRVVGNGHLKMWIGNGGNNFDAIGFGMGEVIPDPDSDIQIVFIPEINVWKGMKKLQLNMKDIRIVEED